MEENHVHGGIFLRAFVRSVYAVATRCQRHRSPETGRIIFFLNFCIKATDSATLAEAEMIQFVSRHTNIPVPKVYCAFVHGKRNFILMEKLNGRPLSDGWLQRAPDSRSRVLEQVHCYIQQLRDLSFEKIAGVSNIIGGPIYDPRLPGKSFWGPYKIIGDFHRELRNNIGMEHVAGDNDSDLKDLIVFHNQQWDRAILTHGDLSSLNILARGDKVVGIIDWETAGWMPPYWEYTSAWHVNPQNQYWQREIDSFLTPLPRELEMEKIRRRYFGDF